ncbi:NAD(P)-dependent oxidoreductase [Bacillus niameyensis]|uniref:NAD(P)-dependent oxidoreductase n=1 Tax=Bacillus niameyensis TaxID=1522308 RepID=UPI000784075D|nr:NAD(P)-dependent oxidoreductase [Bacillus niameyensis]
MKLLLTGAFKYSEEHLEELKFLGFDIIFIQDEKVPLQIDVSEIEAVVCNGLFLYNDIRQFKRLKVIQLTSAGFDRVPLSYIKDHEIRLFNAKGVYSIPMAEWVILKILEIYKKSRRFYELQIDHIWEKQRDLFELTDKTAAIIGFGDIGAEVAKRLKAFDVNVIGVGRREIETQYADEYYLIKRVNEVLKKSDIVVLTLPLTDETRYFLDTEKISMMKDKSVLVNVSRGEVINEAALIDSVMNDKFLGVALDVFEKEPLPEGAEIWGQKNVIITPHNSFISDKTNERLFKLVKANLISFIEK